MKTIPWLYCLLWKLNYFNHFEAPVRKPRVSVSVGLVSDSVDMLQTSVLLSQALASANGWWFGNSTATAKNTSLPGPKPGRKKLRRGMQKCYCHHSCSPFIIKRTMHSKYTHLCETSWHHKHLHTFTLKNLREQRATCEKKVIYYKTTEIWGLTTCNREIWKSHSTNHNGLKFQQKIYIKKFSLFLVVQILSSKLKDLIRQLCPNWLRFTGICSRAGKQKLLSVKFNGKLLTPR